MESYFNCCGMCIHLNLYNSYRGKFRCLRRDMYCLATEKKCHLFEGDANRTYKDIDRARGGKWL